jgi:hypothetical protein
LTVSVELPPAVTELGLRLAVAPLGKPLKLRFTVCAEPKVTAVLMVELPADPWAKLSELGLAEIEKSLDGSGGRVAPRAFTYEEP